MIELGFMDVDQVALDELHEVSVIVEDAEAVAREHRQSPRLQLGKLGMRVELHQRQDIVTQDAPESVDDAASEPCAMVEIANATVAVCISPYTWAEPSQEAGVCSSFCQLS